MKLFHYMKACTFFFLFLFMLDTAVWAKLIPSQESGDWVESKIACSTLSPQRVYTQQHLREDLEVHAAADVVINLETDTWADIMFGEESGDSNEAELAYLRLYPQQVPSQQHFEESWELSAAVDEVDNLETEALVDSISGDELGNSEELEIAFSRSYPQQVHSQQHFEESWEWSVEADSVTMSIEVIGLRMDEIVAEMQALMEASERGILETNKRVSSLQIPIELDTANSLRVVNENRVADNQRTIDRLSALRKELEDLQREQNHLFYKAVFLTTYKDELTQLSTLGLARELFDEAVRRLWSEFQQIAPR